MSHTPIVGSSTKNSSSYLFRPLPSLHVNYLFINIQSTLTFRLHGLVGCYRWTYYGKTSWSGSLLNIDLHHATALISHRSANRRPLTARKRPRLFNDNHYINPDPRAWPSSWAWKLLWCHLNGAFPCIVTYDSLPFRGHRGDAKEISQFKIPVLVISPWKGPYKI